MRVTPELTVRLDAVQFARRDLDGYATRPDYRPATRRLQLQDASLFRHGDLLVRPQCLPLRCGLMCSLIQRSISASDIPVLLSPASSPVLSMIVKERPTLVIRNPSRLRERATRSAWVVSRLAISVLTNSALVGGCGRVL
jgi:hypothetical protein